MNIRNSATSFSPLPPPPPPVISAKRVGILAAPLPVPVGVWLMGRAIRWGKTDNLKHIYIRKIVFSGTLVVVVAIVSSRRSAGDLLPVAFPVVVAPLEPPQTPEQEV